MMTKNNRKLLAVFACALLALALSATLLFVPVSARAADDTTVEMPAGINMTPMAPNANMLGGVREVLPQSEVDGAENDVLHFSNANVTTAQHAYRFAHLFMRSSVRAGEKYIFNMRLRVNVGEDGAFATPPTLNSYVFSFNAMNGAVFNATSYAMFNSTEVRIEPSITKLELLANTYGPEEGRTGANKTALINGEWLTITGELDVPAKHMYNGVERDTTDVVFWFRVESADGAANTRNIYIDSLTLVPAVQLANMATDEKHWKSGTNLDTFEWSDKGMTHTVSDNASMLLYHKIAADSTVNIDIVGKLDEDNIDANPWGNAYVIFKNKNERPVADTGLVSRGGNYLVFQFGSDGVIWKECIDGEVETMTVTNLSGAANDIWYWYKNNAHSSVSINTVDTEDGFKATVTFVGNSSSATFRFTCENPEMKGDYSLSLQFHVRPDIAANGSITVSSLTVSGVEEKDLVFPDADVELLNEETAARNVAVTADNYDEIKAFYEETVAVYNTFNLPLLRAFERQNLDAIAAKLTAYETARKAAADADEAIRALPAEVNADNYSEAKAAIEAARATYNALTAAAKSYVTALDALQSAEGRLAAYEESVKPAPPSGDNTGDDDNGDDNNNEDNSGENNGTGDNNGDNNGDDAESGGCSSSSAAALPFVGAVMLCASIIVLLTKKKKA